jgi:hypothetical protein
MKQEKIKIGVDFDGVLAYNPFRVIRAPVTFIKRNVFKSKKTHFYIPQNDAEKFIWAILHESSVFPAIGVELLKERIEKGEIEAHLVSARYSFLQKNLYAWLERHKLKDIFTSITINHNDEQPHVYKARIIKEKGFDYFIEDNYDIVSHVAAKTDTKILWIYNILDRHVGYPHKFPYLEQALRSIIS